MINPFEEKMNQLKAGDIDSFECKREDFFLFSEVWLPREDRKFFKGQAHLGGDITYTYDTTVV